MNVFTQWAAGVCATAAAAGMIRLFLPTDKENRAFEFLLGIVVLFMLVVPLAQIDWYDVTEKPMENSDAQALTETARQQQLTYSARQIENMIDETLQAAGITAEKIQVSMDISEGDRIFCNEVEITLQDLQKESETRYLVQSMVGKEAEVKIHNGS